ncbi:aminopeptidase N [Amycolatopsis sp. FU40]|uniref:aminopeptidase N n=1 Tax=Amycolatopsis sp. FU40 TaxID=2914159 RepID=UPI001EFF9FF4|nr:aminopeptidase N [Amycolatopsis sp. FU40]UKD56927.1 aminopeptidase N [Amycolatopsis sp. FU40]
MASPNLSRAAAEQRAALLAVESYRVVLDLTGSGTFSSVTTVRFSGARREPTWIDLVADRVCSATLNGVALDVSGYREEDGIALPELAEANELVVHAECRYTNTGEGLHRFVDPVDDAGYLYTQFETADAKRVFACFDQPDLKASFTLEVTAPAEWSVIGNTRPATTREAGDGAVTTVFTPTSRLPTYLVALVAGPFASWHDTYRDQHGEIPLGLYCRASLAEHLDAERLFTETKQGFAFYHEKFGTPYPFSKYDQLFVPEFNAGAMENAGAVTFLEDFVFRSRVTHYAYERRAETLLHEMAHMWFGDLVTMRWWDDLWLNESFATFASVFALTEATEYKNAWTSFANVEKAWAYQQDQLPSTHPIAADIADLHAVEVNFDGITYAKGASVLKQLVAYVGQDDFLDGLRRYFARHAWGNATLADLLAALEEASGRDLSRWSAEWLETTGLNTLRPRYEVDGEGRFTSFAVEQSGAEPGAGEHRTHRIAVGVYRSDDAGKLVRAKRIELDVSGERTEVPELAGQAAGDLVLVNDDDLTYCGLRLDPRSLTALIDRIADLADPLPRSLCWSAAWEMTRAAEFRARDYVKLVAGGIAAETELSVVETLLAQARTALGSYADPAWAQQRGWPEFAGVLRKLADGAEPGSDRQLTFVNALAAAPLEDALLDLLTGWLDGTAPLAGLTVDTDLRWRLLQALVAHGRRGEKEIGEALQLDDTAAGRRQAEKARALLPDPEAKAEAWRRALTDDELPNAVSDAIVSGFRHPAQHELLTGYGARYFAEIGEVWERRSSERALPAVVHLFPGWELTPENLAAADGWLAGTRPPALHRLILELRTEMLARPLAARERDREAA